MEEQKRLVLRILVIGSLILSGCQSPPRVTSSSALGTELTDSRMVDDDNPAEKPTTIQHYSTADMDLIPIGAKCEVKLRAADRTLIGRLESVNKSTLILSGVEEVTRHTSEQGVPMLNNVPYVKRMFKNVGTASTSRQIGSATVSSFEIEQIKAELRLDPYEPRDALNDDGARRTSRNADYDQR